MLAMQIANSHSGGQSGAFLNNEKASEIRILPNATHKLPTVWRSKRKDGYYKTPEENIGEHPLMRITASSIGIHFLQ